MRLGCAGLLLGGVAVAIVDGVLILNAWAQCDVGVNAGANGLTYVLFQLPAIALVAVLSGAATQRLVVNWPVPARIVAYAGVLVAIAYLHIWLVATPADYPDPLCTDNVPSWWPWFLPT